MHSFAFPKMLSHTAANIIEAKDAVKSNMILLLSSERNTLFGDPYYGSELKKYLFEQSSSIIADLLIDQIYTTIKTFMPVFISLIKLNLWLKFFHRKMAGRGMGWGQGKNHSILLHFNSKDQKELE